MLKCEFVDTVNIVGTMNVIECDEYDGVVYVNLPTGSILYRGAITIEQNPTPRRCSDTDKTGTYFSAFNPILAETMRLEYEMNHPNYDGEYYVSIYITTEDIKLSKGKYSFTRDYSKYFPGHWAGIVKPEDELSHYDDTIHPHSLIEVNESKVKKAKRMGYAEVFLNKNDLSKIKYIESYPLNLNDARMKWVN